MAEWAILDDFYQKISTNRVLKAARSVKSALVAEVAAAIGLAVDAELFAEAGGGKEAVVLFEVRTEVGDVVGGGATLAYGIDERRVFVRAYRERSCEKVKIRAAGLEIACGGVKTERKADVAAGAALRESLQAAHTGEIVLPRLVGHDERDAAEMVEYRL